MIAPSLLSEHNKARTLSLRRFCCFFGLGAAMRAAAISLSLLCATTGWAGGHSSAGAEFPRETAAIVAATTALFDAVEDGAETPATPNRVVAIPASFDTNALTTRGPVRHLTGYRINWYPVDRFLGAVDFMGTWDGNSNLVCGYVLWDLTDPGAPELDTLVANFVDVAALDAGSATEAHLALLDANCAYGDIDLNYTVFDPAG